MASCGGHAPMSDFKAGGHWVCSGCGKVGAWTDSWSYFGAIGCTKCKQEPVIEYVACSEACIARHRDEKSDLRTRQRETRREMDLRSIDEQIAVLQQRRQVLRKQGVAKDSEARAPGSDS